MASILKVLDKGRMDSLSFEASQEVAGGQISHMCIHLTPEARRCCLLWYLTRPVALDLVNQAMI